MTFFRLPFKAAKYQMSRVLGEFGSISRKVGKNQAVSQEVVQALRESGKDFAEMSPREKGAKIADEKKFIKFAQRKGIHFLNHYQTANAEHRQDFRDAFLLASYYFKSLNEKSKIVKHGKSISNQ